MFDNMLFWSRQSKDLGAKLQKLFGRIESDKEPAQSDERSAHAPRSSGERPAVRGGLRALHARYAASRPARAPRYRPIYHQ